MIEPSQALRDVRSQLREEVMPEVGSGHARAVLGAALGILDELSTKVVADVRPAEATVAEVLPAIERWEVDLAAQAPAAAGAVARERQVAEAEVDPSRARVAALLAAELTVRTAWTELEPRDRDRILAEARRVLRADAERHTGEAPRDLYTQSKGSHGST
jgi:hypothetical protein